MKRYGLLFMSGIIAALAGFLLGLPFSNRLLRWIITGICIGVLSHGYNVRNKKLILTVLISAVAVISGWFLGKLITYTMVVWPILGLIIGASDLQKIRITTRIKKGLYGFTGGFVGVHFFPFLFFVIFPWLGLPFMAWDIEKMGLILSGGTIALAIAGRKNE